MKKILKTMMLVVALFTSMMAQAQQSTAKNTQVNREDFAQKQALNIAEQLAFDDKTTNKFVTTYSQYCKEIATMRPTRQPKRDRTETLTDKEVEQRIKARFDHSRKMLDIREKYYNEYSKFLSPKQIERVYQLERQMKDRPGRPGDRGNNQAAWKNNRKGNPGQGNRNYGPCNGNPGPCDETHGQNNGNCEQNAQTQQNS
ncbi:MAG: hypothetical protein ACOYJF_11860 [Prevotella sp.]|jgi:hypothetical protein